MPPLLFVMRWSIGTVMNLIWDQNTKTAWCSSTPGTPESLVIWRNFSTSLHHAFSTKNPSILQNADAGEDWTGTGQLGNRIHVYDGLFGKWLLYSYAQTKFKDLQFPCATSLMTFQSFKSKHYTEGVQSSRNLCSFLTASMLGSEHGNVRPTNSILSNLWSPSINVSLDKVSSWAQGAPQSRHFGCLISIFDVPKLSKTSRTIHCHLKCQWKCWGCLDSSLRHLISLKHSWVLRST
jgi:hypothetical protein